MKFFNASLKPLPNALSYALDSTRSEFKDFVTLMKPGVMTLVVFTGFCGMLLAPGSLHPYVMMVAIVAIALGSGAAGAINMWYDRDIDAIMKRTANRPIPAGTIAPQDALTFGVAMAIISTVLMMMATNIVAGLLLAGSIAFYVFIYTILLKRHTPQNIVIGGAAGSLPPVIGWSSVTGDVTVLPIIFFLIIFLWTPPHFWALALYQSDDYKRANIPILPVVRGPTVTHHYIIVYTILMVMSTFLPYVFASRFFGWFYGISAAILGSIFLYGSVRIYQTRNKAQSFKLFWYSIFYLFILFAAMIVDHCWLLPKGYLS